MLLLPRPPRLGMYRMWAFFRGLSLVIRQEQSSPTEIILVVENSASGASCPLCGGFFKSRHGQNEKASWIRIVTICFADGLKDAAMLRRCIGRLPQWGARPPERW